MHKFLSQRWRFEPQLQLFLRKPSFLTKMITSLYGMHRLTYACFILFFKKKHPDYIYQHTEANKQKVLFILYSYIFFLIQKTTKISEQKYYCILKFYSKFFVRLGWKRMKLFWEQRNVICFQFWNAVVF